MFEKNEKKIYECYSMSPGNYFENSKMILFFIDVNSALLEISLYQKSF